MEPRDDDILDFDFFDESPTREEASTQRVRMPRRGGGGGPGGPRRPLRSAPGFAPLARLVGLIAFAILIVVLLVFWVQSCASAGKHNEYKHYMESIATIAGSSARIGRDLNDELTTPGLKEADLEPKLRGLAQQEQQDVVHAQSLNPPGRLRPEHLHLIEALQFRVSGLQGLAQTFHDTAASKNDAQDAELLAEQAQRLVASDVVWDDLFKDPSVAELQKQNVTGVPVPDSDFIVNPDLASVRSMGPVLQRIRGASTGGTPSGIHGTNIVSVKALPSGQELSQSTENTVTTSTNLGFSVTIQDSGNSQEVKIKVTLTIPKSPTSIVKTQTLDLINAGETKTVEFHDLGQVPFVQKTEVKIDVSPVPGEANTSNNSGTYPVIFSLPA